MPAKLKVYDNREVREFFAEFHSMSELMESFPRVEDIFHAFSVADVGIRDTRPHSPTALLRMLGALDEISTHTVRAYRPEIGRQWASKLASVCSAISKHTQKYLVESGWFDCRAE